MNRQQHLLQTAQRVAAWPHHAEHLVLDWSSRSAVDRSQLPRDPRLRLERVEGEPRWNLCRAYNLAVRLARGNLLLKLDADCWPEELDSKVFAQEYPLCWFGSGSFFVRSGFRLRLGFWFVRRQTLRVLDSELPELWV